MVGGRRKKPRARQGADVQIGPAAKSSSPGCRDRGSGSYDPTGYEVGRECPLSVRSELAETNTWRLTCGPSYEVFGRRQIETFRMRSRPASKKRRGTKSREGWRRLCGERYGDLIRGQSRWGPLPWSEATCMPGRGSGRESEKRVSAGS